MAGLAAAVVVPLAAAIAVVPVLVGGIAFALGGSFWWADLVTLWGRLAGMLPAASSVAEGHARFGRPIFGLPGRRFGQRSRSNAGVHAIRSRGSKPRWVGTPDGFPTRGRSAMIAYTEALHRCGTS